MTREEYARQHAELLARDDDAVADFEIGVLVLPEDVARHLAAIIDARRKPAR